MFSNSLRILPAENIDQAKFIFHGWEITCDDNVQLSKEELQLEIPHISLNTGLCLDQSSNDPGLPESHLPENDCNDHEVTSIYNIPVALDFNPYIPWINQHDYWLTNWLITHANISQAAASELISYLHIHGGEFVNMPYNNMRDVLGIFKKIYRNDLVSYRNFY